MMILKLVSLLDYEKFNALKGVYYEPRAQIFNKFRLEKEQDALVRNM